MGADLFPPRSERGVLDIVTTAYPFPLAVTYDRLQSFLDRQEAAAAVLALRDAVECLVKYCACIAVANLFTLKPDRGTLSGLADLLVKPTGLSIGDWHTLLIAAAKPAAKLLSEAEHGVAMTALDQMIRAFVIPNRKLEATRLSRLIDSDQESFVNWRNTVLSHGVFGRGHEWYASEAIRWISVLESMYQDPNLAPMLIRARLVQAAGPGTELSWMGLPAGVQHAARHVHVLGAEPEPLSLVDSESRETLPLGALLTVQTCVSCGQPAVFFFDRYRSSKRLIEFLEFSCGQRNDRVAVPGFEEILASASVKLRWDRISQPVPVLRREEHSLFDRVETDYIRPSYLLASIWDQVDQRERGYIYLKGDSGIGKTWLVRGLETEKRPGMGVLAFHILSGNRTNYQTFVTGLNQSAVRTLGQGQYLRTPREGGSREAARELAEYLGDIRRITQLNVLILAIDGLDELPDAEAGIPSIPDFLPSPENLPAGCFVLLSSRPQLRPSVQAAIQRVRRSDPELFYEISMDAASPANRTLLVQYLQKALPVAFNTPEGVDTVIDRANGIFLFVFHLSEALRAGVYQNVSSLPDASSFYGSYLHSLRTQAGGHLFETLYLPVLLHVAAAQRPVTAAQLGRWGIPSESLHFALIDLRHFFRVHRSLPWVDRFSDSGDQNNYFELAHEAFARFVRSDDQLAARITSIHASIAQIARNRYCGRWKDATATDDGIYDLRFAPIHARLGGVPEVEEQVYHDADYGEACLAVSRIARARDHNNLFYALSGHAHRVFVELASSPSSATNVRSLYADSLRELAIAHEYREDYVSANRLYAESVAICQALFRDEATAENRKRLAEALHSQAIGFRYSDQYAAAIDCGSRAEEVVTAASLTDHILLGKIIRNRGIALESKKALEEAVVDYTRAVSILRQGNAAEQSEETAEQLALALNSYGWGYLLRKEYETALAAFQESESLLRRLSADCGVYHNQMLAQVLWNKAGTLARLNRFAEAILCCQESASLRQYLVDTEGCAYLLETLADTNNGLAYLFVASGQAQKALDPARRAANLYLSLMEKEGQAGIQYVGFARALALASRSAYASGVSAGSPQMIDKALTLSSQHTQSPLSPDISNSLISAAALIAATLLDQCRFSEAACLYERALQTFAAHLGDATTGQLLSSLYLGKARALFGLKRFRDGSDSCKDGIEFANGAIGDKRDDEINNLMASLVNFRVLLLICAGDFDDADAILSADADVDGYIHIRDATKRDACILMRHLVTMTLSWRRNRYDSALAAGRAALSSSATVPTSAVWLIPFATFAIADSLLHLHMAVPERVTFQEVWTAWESLRQAEETIAIAPDTVGDRVPFLDALSRIVCGEALSYWAAETAAFRLVSEGLTLARCVFGEKAWAVHVYYEGVCAQSRMSRQLNQRANRVSCWRAAVADLNDLYSRLPDTETGLTLAKAYRQCGIAEEESGRQQDAVLSFTNAVKVMRDVIRSLADPRELDLLATVINSLGVGLKNNREYAEALASYDEAIEIRNRLPQGCNRQEWMSEIALLESNRASVFESLKDYHKSFRHRKAALEVRRDLHAKTKNSANTAGLANAANGMALAYRNLERYAEALAAYQESIDLRRTFPKGSDREEWLAEIARLHVNRSITFRMTDRPDQAIVECRCAEEIIRPIMEIERSNERSEILAWMLEHKGNALKALERFEEARLAYSEEVALRRRFFDDQPNRTRAIDLAEALENQSESDARLANLLDRDNAAAEARQLRGQWE